MSLLQLTYVSNHNKIQYNPKLHYNEKGKNQTAEKRQKDPSVFPFLLSANVDLVQPSGRPRLLHLSKLSMCARGLLFELL